MDDGGIVDNAVQIAAGGAGAGGGFYAIRWFFQWITGRLDRRQDLLDAQDQRVDREWQAIREELKADNDRMKARLEAISRQNEAIRFAFHHVAAALIRIDPKNPALIQAEQMLAKAFPVDFGMMLDRIDAAAAASELAKTDT
ncbi:hypothetical protein [Sphingomonas colocasiae]|uniref:Uncharacterized protein n=1 Tax=Sphingomonas colocasiae TaxID=1848973 RepID=A0ABS7PYU0_9SPHN|nr:hypothetical protein [Sphingomonas colocasiae]MBY8826129.1 hypothetical protein [Sphingomonas colocasiae]